MDDPDLDEDDRKDPLFNPTEEQIRQALLESRADIAAGRVVSGEVVLAELRRKIDDHFRVGARKHGEPVK